MSQPLIQPLLPMLGHMTLNPAGIERFATIMHLIFAHSQNPSPVGDERHHKAALDYVMAHKRTVALERVAADASSATYSIGYPNHSPIIARIAIGKRATESLSIQTPTGAFVPIDFTKFVVKVEG